MLKKKILFLLLLFIAFLLLMSTDSLGAATSDLSSLTELQQETIKKTWDMAVSELSGYGHTLDTCYYFVIYSTEYDICHVIMINKEKSTDRQILNKGSFDWANMYHCKPNEEPSGYCGGINTDYGWSNAYSSTVGSSPIVVANNVTATKNQYNNIRTYEEVSFLKSGYTYEISLSTAEETFDKIRAYSNWFSLTDLSKYEVYVSTDTTNWETMHYETLTDAESGTTNFRFYWDIYQNGYYYFKFLNTETNEEEYFTYTITNIGYDIFFSTEETSNPIYCYSNTFTYDTMWVYISKDGINWQSMNTEFVDYNTGDIMNSTERFWHYITENRNILF